MLDADRRGVRRGLGPHGVVDTDIFVERAPRFKGMSRELDTDRRRHSAVHRVCRLDGQWSDPVRRSSTAARRVSSEP